MPTRRQLPLKHISIRVPWHDAKWNGRVCTAPRDNASCLHLRRIAEERDDAAEAAAAGRLISELGEKPPCLDENGTFLSNRVFERVKTHPYSYDDKYKHFAPTPFSQPAKTAIAIPFRWMLYENAFGGSGHTNLKSEYALSELDERYEENLQAKRVWIQHGENQKQLLESFFSAIRPAESLAFFYAKRSPLSEDPRRVLVGISSVTSVGHLLEYDYTGYGNRFPGYLWERFIGHSFHEKSVDAVLLPYHELLALSAEKGVSVDDGVVMVPPESQLEFSYSSEHVSHDTAIGLLLQTQSALTASEPLLGSSFDAQRAWIDGQLNRIWKMRGAFPGMGSALSALGVEHGTLVAQALEGIRNASVPREADAWQRFDAVCADIRLLPSELAPSVGSAIRLTWRRMADVRKERLKLLSRMNLTRAQAERSFSEADATDSELLENPYRVFEIDRVQADAVPLSVIDRALYPSEEVKRSHPLPRSASPDGNTDTRRVRAVTVAVLDSAAMDGHTVLSAAQVSELAAARPLDPRCHISPDMLNALTPELQPMVHAARIGEAGAGFQLDEYVNYGRLIRECVKKRVAGARHAIRADWAQVLERLLNLEARAEDARELRARAEKVACLQEMAASRFTLLLGPAGTGKTTLLRALIEQPEVRDHGVLLLAPTGKARVRLEERTGHAAAQTIAQFLLKCSRYDVNTGRHIVTGDATTRTKSAGTVIIDEASMLTEDQLASVIDAIDGMTRFILVGDTKQLPPIGAGKPLVDIENFLVTEEFRQHTPRVAKGVVELTEVMRQGGSDRDDVAFAAGFSRRDPSPTWDETVSRVLKGEGEAIRVVSWDAADDLKVRLIETIVDELKLSGLDDEVGFACSYGGVRDGDWAYFNPGAAGSTDAGSAGRVEAWQILAPNRSLGHGVEALNRFVQQTMRAASLRRARDPRGRRVPAPKGPQQVHYGDKIINVINERHAKRWPKNAPDFIANGDVGVVVGPFRRPGKPFFDNELQIAFSSRPGATYDFANRYFGEEKGSQVELAYALTVHKAQGSEFGITFVVIPERTALLSAELLYTALTRQQERTVLLVQGDPRRLVDLASPLRSETLRRFTNLFVPPTPIQFALPQGARYLDSRLLHRTEKGDLVRSKSEVIIADKLHSRGIRYVYEQPIELGDGITRLPDFTITDDESGVTWVWEHLGMLTDAGYRAKWELKHRAFLNAGFQDAEDSAGASRILVVTEDDPRGGIDAAQIARLADRIAGR